MLFSSVDAPLPYLEILEILEISNIASNERSSAIGFDTCAEHLPKLHTVELIRCSTNHVEPGVISVLSHPSVKKKYCFQLSIP